MPPVGLCSGELLPKRNFLTSLHAGANAAKRDAACWPKSNAIRTCQRGPYAELCVMHGVLLPCEICTKCARFLRSECFLNVNLLHCISWCVVLVVFWIPAFLVRRSSFLRSPEWTRLRQFLITRDIKLTTVSHSGPFVYSHSPPICHDYAKSRQSLRLEDGVGSSCHQLPDAAA